jgi:tetratricopeptide (TPR) repeat protein
MAPAYEKLILQAAAALKNTGKPYIDALEWISRNSTDDERQKALYELSRIYADMGDKAAAVKYLGELKKYKVPADDILRAEAKVLYENQDYKGAYEKLTAIKHLTKDDLPMLRDVLSAAPDKEKALAFYEKVLKTLGSDAGDSMSMAENLYIIGKKTEAVYYYKQVLSKDPANEWALYRIGTILHDAEGKEAIKKLSEGNSPLSKFAKSIIQGQDVNKKLEELK